MVTTLLVLVNTFNSVLVSTPNEPGQLTALALWIVACISFVFVSLLSYVFILVRLRWFNAKSNSAGGDYQPPSDGEKKPNINIDLVMLSINGFAFLVFTAIYILYI